MAAIKDEKEAVRAASDRPSSEEHGHNIEVGELVNASGHVQEVDRTHNLLTLAGVGLVVGNVWPAIGGAILTSLFNGGEY
jgi:hypothetical protein